MDEAITFLPWLRRGLAQALTAEDPLSGPIPRGPSVTAWVDVLDVHASRAVRLHGPDQVSGLAPGQVLRSEPRPDSVEVEPTLFPYVELDSPDLPWMYTSAAHNDGRLRPWLVLVVLREQEGVELQLRDGALPVLRIESDLQDELPDLDDSWAWVHVQSLAGVSGAAAAVSAGTGEVVARLVCPRRLLPDSSWLACVVPAFDGGVARGLGEAIPEGTQWQPAWERNGTVGPLPVYHHWRFSTGPDGDFEALCRRLKADDTGTVMGLHAIDVTDPGLVDAADATVLLDYEGALQTEGVQPRAWDETHKTDFQDELEPLLNASAARAAYDPAIAEPLVGPPLYGQWPSGSTAVPTPGWVRALNMNPVRRASAGLGARVVRAKQEELVASAWEQAGALRATMTALNQGRLAVELGRRVTGRVAALADGDALQLTAPLQALLGSGAQSARARLLAAGVPAGLVSATHLRMTRAGTALARDWPALTGAPAARLGAEHVETTIAATGDETKVAALAFAHYGGLSGALVADSALTDVREPTLSARARARLGPRPELEPVPQGPSGTSFPFPSEDVSGIAADVIEALDPLAAVRANVLARVPALEGVIAEASLPTTLALGPTFSDPLYEDVVALGAEYLMPGAGELPRNRVRLVETNSTFVGACLIGAQHELARELLWRDYPADLRTTFFERFWRYRDAARVDVSDLAGWAAGDSIAENMAEAGTTMTVFVVRGDIVRRYPTAHYFLQQAQIDARTGEIEPVPGKVVAASFRGALDADTLFVGFDLEPAVVIGDREGGGDPGWLLAIEEQPAGPRFGLDDPAGSYGVAPGTWNDLSWANVAKSEAVLAGLTHAPVDVAWLESAPIEDGTTWGRNAAHMARACWQRPFRMYIPADQMD